MREIWKCGAIEANRIGKTDSGYPLLIHRGELIELDENNEDSDGSTWELKPRKYRDLKPGDPCAVPDGSLNWTFLGIIKDIFGKERVVVGRDVKGNSCVVLSDVYADDDVGKRLAKRPKL